MGRIFGYVAERIIETQEEADAARYDTQSRGYRRSDRRQIAGRKDIGDYEWKDRPGSTRMDGRQIINAEDQFLLGYALPHSTGGIGNTFRYRNWTLNVYMDYACLLYTSASATRPITSPTAIRGRTSRPKTSISRARP